MFICHIHNYTEYNQQWNVFSAFNPSKCTHTWSSGQPTLQRLGSSWGFGGLLKGLTSVVDNSYRSRNSNPQPRVTSLTLYPLEPRLLIVRFIREVKKRLLMCHVTYYLLSCLVFCFPLQYWPNKTMLIFNTRYSCLQWIFWHHLSVSEKYMDSGSTASLAHLPAELSLKCLKSSVAV